MQERELGKSNLEVSALGLGSSPRSTLCRAKYFLAFSRPGAKPPDLASCTVGDDSSSKRIAVELIRDVGFDPVDAGPLWIARYIEPFALLVGQLANEGKGGPELAYRFERFAK